MPEAKKTGEGGKSGGTGAMSRRDFVNSMAMLGVTAEAARPIPHSAAPGAGRTGVSRPVSPQQNATPSARQIQITVNGWKYEILVEPEWALRDVLREQLGFLSVKDMCNGHGACGSCTVIADGRPVLSCMTLAVECCGMTIETAEGVAEAKPKLIEAYVLNHCMQCGYCTPGFVVTAKALLDRVPRPTENDIREALGGNICRCGTYPQHLIAVLEASAGGA